MAPMMLCVVETGHPIQLATVSQSAAASREESIPQTRISGLPRIGVGSMMPFRMVLVTFPPAIKAPENSKIAAMIIACLILIAHDPTEVPSALATSFAPIPQVM